MSTTNSLCNTSENVSLFIGEEEEEGKKNSENQELLLGDALDNTSVNIEASKPEKQESKIKNLDLTHVKFLSREDRQAQRINYDLLTSIEDGDLQQFRK